MKEEMCSCGCLRTVSETPDCTADESRQRKGRLLAAVPVLLLLVFAAIAWSLPAPDANASRILAATADLIKLRLTAMATLPAALAWFSADAGFAGVSFAGMVLGVFTSAAGAAALNQWSERHIDGRMNRTRTRPLPSRIFRPQTAFTAGIAALAGGTLLLALTTNLLAAGLALFAGLTYWIVYTPLKRRTRWCTEVGAISGAVPPLIGWVAATGSLDFFAWTLFGVLYLWQMPHFHPIAWRYRNDYRNAGLRMRAIVESTGNQAANHSIAYSTLLAGGGFIPFAAGEIGSISLAAFLVLGAVYFAGSVRFRFSPDRDLAARRLFALSLIYLPLLLSIIAVERLFL